jgi:cytochrome c oxidase subunit I
MSYLNDGERKGILGWLLSMDHKRIGILYLISMVSAFFIAMTIGVLMRVEQLALNPPLFAPQTYNAFFTVHGVIMIFMFVIPGLPAVFGNFFLPIMIGAKDVSFPRLNLMSWYFFIGGTAVVIASLFTGNGAPDTGWTF